MSDFWKSWLFVWLPVGVILWIAHYAFWGEVDISSYFLAVIVTVVCEMLDKEFGYKT